MYHACQPITVLTCHSCLLWARPVHVTLLSHQPTVTGQARLLWLNLHNKPPYQLYPLRVTSHVITHSPILQVITSIMTETEWTQTADTESQSIHQQVSHASLILGYPAYVIHRSPSTTHGCPYKLFAGWCSLQELLHSPLYSLAAFIRYCTSSLNAGYHLKLK